MSGYPESTQDRSSAPIARVESGIAMPIRKRIMSEKLTRDAVEKLFHYDPETGEVTRRCHAQHNATKGAVVSYRRKDGYRLVGINNKNYLLHRVIWLLVHGTEPKIIDHINRDPSDNRLCNLRAVTQTCNLRNRSVGKTSTTGVKGVNPNTSRSIKIHPELTWRAYIGIGGKHIEMGMFECLVEAVAHRLAAEQCLDWSGCESSSTAYQFMQKYLKEKQCI